MKRLGMVGALLLLPLGCAGRCAAAPAADPRKRAGRNSAEIGRFEDAPRTTRAPSSTSSSRSTSRSAARRWRKYQSQIDKEESDEKVRRISAITLFETFLHKYPNDERWTPDAMFRLAELYFEKSNDEYLTATAQANQTGAQVDARLSEDHRYL